MARVSFVLLVLAGLVLGASAVWMQTEHLAPGLQVTVAPGTGTGWDSLPRLSYTELLTLHGVSGGLLLPLLGAFAGFAAAEGASRPGAARLAGWNGLAIAVAVIVALTLDGPAAAHVSEALADILAGQEPPAPVVPGRFITDAAGLWAAYVGAAALLGRVAGFVWPARIVQLTAAAFCALYLWLGSPDFSSGADLLLLGIPALALIGVCSVQLAQSDTPPAPHLWCAAALMLVSQVAAVGSLSWNSRDTIAETTALHSSIYLLAPFLMIAAWRSWKGWSDGGGWAWGHALGLMVLCLMWMDPLYEASVSRLTAGSLDPADVLATSLDEAALLGFVLIGWFCLGFTRFAARSPVPSAPHGS